MVLAPGSRLGQGQRGSGAAVHLVRISWLVEKLSMRKSKQERTSARVLGDNSGDRPRNMPKRLKETTEICFTPSLASKAMPQHLTLSSKCCPHQHGSEGEKRQARKGWLEVKSWASTQPAATNRKGQVRRDRQDWSGKQRLASKTLHPPSVSLADSACRVPDSSCPHFLTSKFPGLSREIVLQAPKS